MTLTPVKLKRDKVDFRKLHVTPERLYYTKKVDSYPKR